MDNVGMDAELASEMVKLLAQELKSVRGQLREAERRTPTTPSNRLAHDGAEALIAENDSLKTDNAVLQEWVATLRDEIRQVSSIKSEGDAEPSMSHMNDEFAKLLAENQDLVRGKEKALRNQDRLTILQEKYKRAKAKVHEYDETLSELRVALENCTRELEQSRSAVVSDIDFRSFLSGLPYKPVQGQPELSSILPYSHRDKLHKGIGDICNGPYFIHCEEVIWSKSGIALGLVIKPTFQYNPKIGGGTWAKLEDGFKIGQLMDVCCLSGKTARYLGTYERVGEQGTTMIATEALKYLDGKKLNFASKRTTLFPDLVPPSQTQMIRNMYKKGVIKLQCFGIRCVAFNQIFAGKLQEMSRCSTQRPDNAVIPAKTNASGDDRKRKRDSKSTSNPNRKKRKH